MRLAPGPPRPPRPGTRPTPPRSRRRPAVGGGIADPAGPRPPREARALATYLAATCGGTAIALAWWVPETATGALLGWIAAVAARLRHPHGAVLPPGLLLRPRLLRPGLLLDLRHGLGLRGIRGGPRGPDLRALRRLRRGAVPRVRLPPPQPRPRLRRLRLLRPVALVLSEFASVRLFRWHYGHTQLAFTPFVQVADLGGSLLVSFLMFWLAEAGVRMIAFRERRQDVPPPRDRVRAVARLRLRQDARLLLARRPGAGGGARPGQQLPRREARPRRRPAGHRATPPVEPGGHAPGRPDRLARGGHPDAPPRRRRLGAGGARPAVDRGRLGIPRRLVCRGPRREAVQCRLRRPPGRHGPPALLQADPDPVRRIHALRLVLAVAPGDERQRRRLHAPARESRSSPTRCAARTGRRTP